MVNVLDFFSLESANVTLLFERLMREPSFFNSLPWLRVTGPCTRSSSLSSKEAEVGPDMDIVSIRYGSKINFALQFTSQTATHYDAKIGPVFLLNLKFKLTTPPASFDMNH